MRILAIIVMVFMVFAAGAAQASPPASELVTAADAILCLEPGSLAAASQAEMSQRRLRGLRCMRIGSGIPLTVLERTGASVWKVSFRPQGIPGGVTLWGNATSFTTPDGAPVIHSQRAER